MIQPKFTSIRITTNKALNNALWHEPSFAVIQNDCFAIDIRGGNKIIFTFARLASESNFTLASEDLHPPGGENMQNENH